MRKQLLLATVLVACLCFASAVRADIIGWNCDDDGDGSIVMYDPCTSLVYNSGADEYTLSMEGVQYDVQAHIEGDFDSDTELDPTVWIIQAVENDTTFDWTDYHIVIGMSKDFTIGASVIAPTGWTSQITQPTGGQTIPNGGTGWVGVIDYYIGTGDAVEIGQTGDFGFSVSFLGDVDFCTEQTPTPEPTSLLLLAAGGLMLRRKR